MNSDEVDETPFIPEGSLIKLHPINHIEGDGIVHPSRNLLSHNVTDKLPMVITKSQSKPGNIPSDISLDHVCGFKIPEFHKALDMRDNLNNDTD